MYLTRQEVGSCRVCPYSPWLLEHYSSLSARFNTNIHHQAYVVVQVNLRRLDKVRPLNASVLLFSSWMEIIPTRCECESNAGVTSIWWGALDKLTGLISPEDPEFCQQVIKAFLKSRSPSSNGKISSPPKSTGNVRKPPGDLYRLIRVCVCVHIMLFYS